jgi:tetratricopeptide (TPR) repeat protein
MKTRLFHALGGAALTLCLALAATACSTAPKAGTVVFERRNQAVALAKKGDGLYSQGRYSEALDLFRQAMELDIAVDYDEGTVMTRVSMGKCYAAADMVTQAADEYAQAERLAARLGRADLMASVSSYQAELMIKRGDYAAAQEQLLAALKKAGQNPAAQALILHNLGLCARAEENHQKAADYFSQAAAINLGRKERAEYASNCYMLASSFLRLGKVSEARAWASKALEADRATERSQGIAQDYYALGKVEQSAKNGDEAIFYYEKSLNVCLVTNQADLAAKVLGELVSLSAERGDEAARAHYADLLSQLQGLKAKK